MKWYCTQHGKDHSRYGVNQWETIVTSLLIGWAHTQNDPCMAIMKAEQRSFFEIEFIKIQSQLGVYCEYFAKTDHTVGTALYSLRWYIGNILRKLSQVSIIYWTH